MISLLNGILLAFEYSARNAIVPIIVDKNHILEANSFRSSVSSLNMIIGYSIGGIIVSTFGYSLSFLIDSLTFINIAILISFIRANEMVKSVKKELFLKDISKGLREMANDIKNGVSFIKDSMIIKRTIILNLIYTLIISMQTPLVYFLLKIILAAESY